MKLKNVWLAGLFATGLVFTACEKDKENDETANAQDKTFALQASQSNRSEIQLSQMALTQAASDGIKTYAQTMITHHTMAETELQDIVDDIDLDVNLTDTLAPDQVALRNRLMGLTGAAFDSVYINGQVMSHQKTLTIFDAQLSGGTNAKVRQYATEKRPAIQMHLDMADSLATTVQ
jgi:putative membrane protein